MQRIKAFTRIGADARGQSMAEFALVFPVILLLIMGIMEFSLLATAHLVVNYAAFAACRSAIVHNADAEKMKRAAAIACIPISPNSSAMRGLGGRLNMNFGFLSMPNSGYRSAAEILDKASFSYYTTEVESVRQGGAYKVTVHHLYPLKFPCISGLADFISGPSSPVEIFSPSPITPPESLNSKARMINRLTGSRFIVVSKECIMGG